MGCLTTAAWNRPADWAALTEPRAPVPPALPALSEAEGSEAEGLASGPLHQFFNNLLGTHMAEDPEALQNLDLPTLTVRGLAKEFSPGMILMMTGIGTSHLITAPVAASRASADAAEIASPSRASHLSAAQSNRGTGDRSLERTTWNATVPASGTKVAVELALAATAFNFTRLRHANPALQCAR